VLPEGGGCVPTSSSGRRGEHRRGQRAAVARTDTEGWSLYGAPWLQPVAIGRKSISRQLRPAPNVGDRFWGAERARMYRMEGSAAYASSANSRCKRFPLSGSPYVHARERRRARGKAGEHRAPLCELRPPIARISSPRKVIWRSDDLRLLDAVIASDSAPTGGAGGIWTHFPDGHVPLDRGSAVGTT
jgi:hypothetical protein